VPKQFADCTAIWSVSVANYSTHACNPLGVDDSVIQRILPQQYSERSLEPVQTRHKVIS
jgi:hypothetical protein